MLKVDSDPNCTTASMPLSCESRKALGAIGDHEGAHLADELIDLDPANESLA
jgi:hypothetical protein